MGQWGLEAAGAPAGRIGRGTPQSRDGSQGFGVGTSRGFLQRKGEQAPWGPHVGPSLDLPHCSTATQHKKGGAEAPP